MNQRLKGAPLLVVSVPAHSFRPYNLFNYSPRRSVFVSRDNIGIEEGVPHIKTGANTWRELEEPIIFHHSLKNYRIGAGRIAQLGKCLLCKWGPEFESQNPCGKIWVWWGLLITVEVRRQRWTGPWGLKASQPSLLGVFRASETVSQDKIGRVTEYSAGKDPSCKAW